MEPSPEFRVRIAQNYSSTDIDNYGKWIRSVDSTLNLLGIPKDSCNYRVPSKLRAVMPEAYTPQVVSVGPFHRNKPELRGMEEFKWRYMLSFLDGLVETDIGNMHINVSQGESSENSPRFLALDKCCRVISELEAEARAFYAEEINLDKHQLMEMLLVDSCFILEHIRRMNTKLIPSEETVPIDLPAGNLMMRLALCQDFLLLENQIPYIILQKLFELVPSSRKICNASGEMSLQEFIYTLFRHIPMLRLNIPVATPIPDATFSNILDMLYRVSVTAPEKLPNLSNIPLKWGLKSCAAELIKSGIRISLHSSRVSAVDIKFYEGELILPIFTMNTYSITLLRNLIAMEQTRNIRHVIISYVVLMSSLVRSREDVYFLERAGIILKVQREFEYGENYFQTLSKEANCADFVFRGLCEEVDNYKLTMWRWDRVKGFTIVTWHRWIESIKDLKRDYFKNRWSFITFFAASFIILLTVVQTFYTIRAYYPPYH
ncbi:UPF0481 protein At3g47200-like [Apium graveolens]|uniref:UPF0481 protein At3g47200-like n=1 Tax=Apium graveolens TaxID=4045 RepID=UPI003D7A1007